MSPPDPGFTAVILAGRRDAVVDPLASQAGVANKSLALLLGRPLIRYVADAIAATPGVAAIHVVAETSAWADLRAALRPHADRLTFIPSADNLADSVYAAARGVTGPLVITTSDNVLLTPPAVTALVGPLAQGADATVAMARREAVLAAHPDGQRRFYRFADDAYSNCNLYGLSGPGAVALAEGFRSGGQFAKKPLRLVMALGPVNLLLLLTGRFSLAAALNRVSRRFGLRIAPVILADGAHAIDVDNARTYACAEAILEGRTRRAA